jgi:methylated-DNA-[protein]-cysteine S-methyltransferase
MMSENGQTALAADARIASMKKSTVPESLFVAQLESPIGAMLVVHDAAQCLRVLDFQDYESRMHRLLRLHYGQVGEDFSLQAAAAPRATRDALQRYFSGDLAAIESIPTTTGGTEFQRDVWAALRRIPVGTTVSYGALARQLSCPKAVRAVGLANGANPISIVVPCHRVIGADASLTGYGGGIERKRWLLSHEGIHFRSDRHVA